MIKLIKSEECIAHNWPKKEIIPTFGYDYEKSTQYFGIDVFENVLLKIFKDVKEMPHGNPDFDFICNKEYKIQARARCLNDHNAWNFSVDMNDKTDYFLFGGFDNRIDMYLCHAWLIYKYDIIDGKEFWNRYSFSIKNIIGDIDKYTIYEIPDKTEDFNVCFTKIRFDKYKKKGLGIRRKGLFDEIVNKELRKIDKDIKTTKRYIR